MKKLRRYLKIFGLITKFSFMKMSAYRLDFFMGFLGSTIYNVAALLFLNFVLVKIATIAGWDFFDMVLLHAVGQVWAYLYFFISFPSLYSFNELITEGSMDFILLKPLNPIFLSTIRRVDFLALIAMIQPAAMFIYVFANKSYNISILTVLLSSVSMIMSIAIVHLLEAALSSSSFWFTNSELGRGFYRTANTTSYPYEIYSNKWVRIIFLTIVPYALIVNVPFRALIGGFDYRLLLLQVLVLIMFVVLASLSWRWGLKRYQSASS